MKPKQHLEFVKVDLAAGWQRPPGYPPGFYQKILASDLDEKKKCGSRTRLLLACLDFIMHLLLGGGHGVFGILSADGQVGELLGECLSHVFPPS